MYKHYRETGSVGNRSRAGRPTLFTARRVTALSQIVKKKRTGTSHEILNEFHESTSVQVREMRQRNDGFINCGMTSALLEKKKSGNLRNQQKEASPVPQRQNPLDCAVHGHWKKVVFSDETTIVIKPNGRVKVWRKLFEKNGQVVGTLHVGPKNTLKLMVSVL